MLIQRFEKPYDWHRSRWCTLLIALNGHNRYVYRCASCFYRYLHICLTRQKTVESISVFVIVFAHAHKQKMMVTLNDRWVQTLCIYLCNSYATGTMLHIAWIFSSSVSLIFFSAITHSTTQLTTPHAEHWIMNSYLWREYLWNACEGNNGKPVRIKTSSLFRDACLCEEEKQSRQYSLHTIAQNTYFLTLSSWINVHCTVNASCFISFWMFYLPID